MTTRNDVSFEIGRKYTAEETKSYADSLINKMYARWKERIFSGPFMQDLESGRLPLDTIRLFWRQWYSYPVEINNFHLVIYTSDIRDFSRATAS
jgi:thiaminase